MVYRPSLQVIVSADFRSAIAVSHPFPTHFSIFLVGLLLAKFVHPHREYPNRHPFVLPLVPSVNEYLQSSGFVTRPDSTFHLVAILPTRSTTFGGLDVQFLGWEGFGLPFGWEGQNCYADVAGLFPTVVFGGWDTLNAMLTGFVGKCLRNAIASDFQRLFSSRVVKDFGLQTEKLGIFEIGGQQFSTENFAVVSAGAC